MYRPGGFQAAVGRGLKKIFLYVDLQTKFCKNTGSFLLGPKYCLALV